MQLSKTVGVIGGSGQLGGAIARAWLRSGCITPENLWISNRSGKMLGFEEWRGISLTTRNKDLVSCFGQAAQSWEERRFRPATTSPK